MTKGTIQNREAFLQQLTEKLGTKQQPISTHPFVPINDFPQRQLADKTPEELLEIAKARVPRIHTQIIETTKGELEQTLLDLVKEFGDGNVLLPSDPRFAEYGLNTFTETNRSEAPFTCQFWKKGNEFRQENIETAQEANIAIAFAEFLLAESGSVVVETSSGQGRSLHFLPKHYVSIVPMSKIVPRSTQAAAYYSDRQANGEKVGSAIHIISGPSNSGDIEMQLVVGLHGPLKVKYVVVKDM